MITRALALLTALFLAMGVAAAPLVYAQAKKDTSPASAKTDAKPAAKPEGKTALLDINSASADELKALPGVGDAYSKRIIDNRPYVKKDQLVSKKVIPEKTYQGIKDMIIAKQK
jgi:competence protein ComEA